MQKYLIFLLLLASSIAAYPQQGEEEPQLANEEPQVEQTEQENALQTSENGNSELIDWQALQALQAYVGHKLHELSTSTNATWNGMMTSAGDLSRQVSYGVFNVVIPYTGAALVIGGFIYMAYHIFGLFYGGKAALFKMVAQGLETVYARGAQDNLAAAQALQRMFHEEGLMENVIGAIETLTALNNS